MEEFAIAPKVLTNPLDYRRILDACNYAQPPAAAPTEFNLDGNDALVSAHPRQTPLTVGCRWLAPLLGLICSGGTGSGYDPGPIRARRYEHAIKPSQVGG